MKTFPLLQSQMGIYHAWIADTSSVAYNLPAVVPFSLDIDIGRLGKALQHIWQQREELHTRIVLDAQGEPHQWADPDMALPIIHRHMTEKDAQSYIDRGFVRPFAVLEGAPLVRFEVVVTEAHHYLLCDFHHIICDGMTLAHAFLATDLPAAYDRKPLVPHSYGLYQHAEAEQELLHSEQYKRDAQFYQEAFRGVTFTNLTPPTTQPWGKRLNACASLNLTAINAWCQQQNIQPGHLFMAAFSIVLSRLSGNEQVAYITLNHGRTDRRLTQAYGMFVMSVPILTQMEESMPIRDLFIQQKRWLMRTIRHHAYPFTHLCRDLRQIPPITFAFQSQHIVEETPTGGTVTIGYQPVQGTTKNNLSCMVYSKGPHYEVRTEASDALWSQQRLQTITKAIAICVENLMATPNGTLADIDIITTEEKDDLIHLGQGEHLDYDSKQTVATLFLQQAQRTPTALAVTDGCTSLTYQELNDQSAMCAQQLRQEGVKPGDFVPIASGRCTNFLVRALGIMRMGAAYVPIDTRWPKSRQQLVADAAQATENTPGQAYLLYTSGTTGKPKGVMISHHALLNLIHSIVHIFGLTAESRISCHSSFAFDASVEDLFPVLTVGGSVHIMPEDTLLDPKKIHQFLLHHHITGGCYTTHLGTILTKHFNLPMDYICLGGEQLSTYPNTHPRVFNTYGPTEFTVDATYCELPKSPCDGLPPIGRPLPNLTAYVMDVHGHFLPRGEVGELCLTGIQKATNCTDVPYHTGDLVRWNKQGLLEYIGRRDRQLKIRGYRIEPEEIERELEQMDGILQAVVVAAPKRDSLIAYFTTSLPPDDGRLDEKWLSEKLSLTLPNYMVPKHYLRLEKMPLTTSNKPDYAQLPVIEDKPIEHTPPANETERLWCDLFAKVLEVETVGATDNFFHLGGTSITVVSLQAEALQRDIHITYGEVFLYPTPRQLATRENTPKNDVGHTGQPTWGTPVNRHGAHRFRDNGSAPLPPLLLTGATGFLGRYILHELLNTESGPIYCLVRAANEQQAFDKLHKALETTGSHTSERLLGTRIVPVVSDVLSLMPQQLTAHIGMVIHCAADVRHFAPNHTIEDTNILGTDHIIELCQTQQAHLIHISTLSIDAASANPYLRSKAIAEQHVVNAAKDKKLQATIMRVGNLTLPSGELRGVLAAAIEAFHMLGTYPLTLYHFPIELSPVDKTAHAILEQARHTASPLTIIPYQPATTTLASLLADLHPVSDDEFQAILNQAICKPELHAPLMPLLHYQAIAASQGDFFTSVSVLEKNSADSLANIR